MENTSKYDGLVPGVTADPLNPEPLWTQYEEAKDPARAPSWHAATKALAGTVAAAMRRISVRPGRRWTRGRPTGSLDTKRLATALAGTRGVMRRRRRVAGETPPRVSVCIDRSRSMRAEDMEPWDTGKRPSNYWASMVAGALLDGADRAGAPTALYTFGGTYAYFRPANWIERERRPRSVVECLKEEGDSWPSRDVSDSVAWAYDATFAAFEATLLRAGVAGTLEGAASGKPRAEPAMVVILSDDTEALSSREWEQVEAFCAAHTIRLTLVSICEWVEDDTVKHRSPHVTELRTARPGTKTVRALVSTLEPRRGKRGAA